jgi:hypothetical protein
MLSVVLCELLLASDNGFACEATSAAFVKYERSGNGLFPANSLLSAQIWQLAAGEDLQATQGDQNIADSGQKESPVFGMRDFRIA